MKDFKVKKRINEVSDIKLSLSWDEFSEKAGISCGRATKKTRSFSKYLIPCLLPLIILSMGIIMMIFLPGHENSPITPIFSDNSTSGESIQTQSDISGSDKESGEEESHEIEISTDSEGGMSLETIKNIEGTVDLKDYTDILGNIIKDIKEINKGFDVSEYKVYVNIANKEEDSGSIVFLYNIGGIIGCNSAYTVDFYNGIMDKAKDNGRPKSVDNELKRRMLNAVEKFKESGKYAEMQIGKTELVDEIRGGFMYDFKKKELKYEVFVFTKLYYNETEYVIKDDYNCAIIEY